jgi:hypothetical protein
VGSLTVQPGRLGALSCSLDADCVRCSRFAYWITYLVAFLGIVASAVRCYVGYKSVPMFKQPLCSVLEDDFSSLNTNIWAHENLVTGFG